MSRHLMSILGALCVSIRSLGFLGALAIAQVAWAQSPAATPQVLMLGIGLPESSVQARAVSDFAARVEKYSNGLYRIELHAGGKLGNDLTMVNALQQGTLAMTAPDSSTLATLEKSFSAINYPFTFLNEQEADQVLDGEWGGRLLSQLPQHGLIGLAYWENGFRQMTNSRRPLTSTSDFAGLRMRTMQNPMLVDSFRRLGFEAVPMPFPQVFDALQSQAVDGQENPLSTIVSSRFYEVQKYLTLSRHVYSAHVLLVSRKTWDSMSPATQEAFQRAAVESRDLERRLSREVSAAALAELKAKGMQVTSIPRADAERIRHRLRDVLDRYNKDIGVRTMLDLYVQLGKMRTASSPSEKPASPGR
jgi:tripartite ATP-independent transporter DctP family solute receptor